MSSNKDNRIALPIFVNTPPREWHINELFEFQNITFDYMIFVATLSICKLSLLLTSTFFDKSKFSVARRR